MEVIDGMTPDQLRAMADEMEGGERRPGYMRLVEDDWRRACGQAAGERRPGYMRRVEVDGITVDVDMRVIADIRTMRIIADVQGKDDAESAFAAIKLFDRILGDQREAVEGALSDGDGFCPVERYVEFAMRLFEAVGAKN